VSDRVEIGIIGGTGLYEMDAVTDRRELLVETPFGAPSDELLIGTLEGRRVVFLPRHGRGHRILPSELNFRANIWALKSLGVSRILSVSAVGSLKEQYAPQQMVIPDQFVDRTRHRVETFFGNGLVAHVAFAHPFCETLRTLMATACREAGATCHEGGTYLCMEGPAFSTRAESLLYRSWGMDVIGMTNLQEAKLAREAEICYVTLAMVTDYDCWHPEHDSVTADYIMENLRKNAGTAQAVLRSAVRHLDPAAERRCECADALKYALITPASLVPAETKRALAPIISRYIS
jgi:5'-methylthioadenosine phosphorylase